MAFNLRSDLALGRGILLAALTVFLHVVPRTTITLYVAGDSQGDHVHLTLMNLLVPLATLASTIAMACYLVWLVCALFRTEQGTVETQTWATVPVEAARLSEQMLETPRV